MQKLSFQVAEFDAPLDLILHLLSKHKLDIMDIDISSLLGQYITIIDGWKEKNLDVASEFLAMASRLVYMKTVSLLPRHEEESEQLRKDLTGQLTEYRICKLAAVILAEQNNYSAFFVRKQAEIEFDPTYTFSHSPNQLYNALVDAMGRGLRRKPPSHDSFDPIVAKPIVSVSLKIFTVLRTLRANNGVTLRVLFENEESKSALVATFLAVLELVKTGRIVLDNDTISIAA